MAQPIEQLCAAVAQWDARSGVPPDEETGACYVLSALLERPAWRAHVEAELQEFPTVTSMRRCLTVLCLRGGLDEGAVVGELVQAVTAQLERLSEDHAQIVRRRRRWLADALRHGDANSASVRSTQALLTTEVVWEEMRRYRRNFTVWREVTEGVG